MNINCTLIYTLAFPNLSLLPDYSNARIRLQIVQKIAQLVFSLVYAQ